MLGFFDNNFRSPKWYREKVQAHQQRRNFLKSAGGLAALSVMPQLSAKALVGEGNVPNEQHLAQLKLTDPWKTLNAVFDHLLPEDSEVQALGPGAQTLNIFRYAVNVIEQQQVDEQEIAFVFKGVGWLNGYSQQRHEQAFTELSVQQKETTLRGISQSTAGENWLNTLLIYVLEGALSPPAYGGNTEQKGWQWLKHQGGFPLPKAGTRFYELPVTRAKAEPKLTSANYSAHTIAFTDISSDSSIHTFNSHSTKVVKS